MPVGVKAGPVWASTSGRRKFIPVWWHRFGLMLLCWMIVGWVAGNTVAVWVAWVWVPLWAACRTVGAVRRWRARRRLGP